MIRRVRQVHPLNDCRLMLEFDDGASGVVDIASRIPFEGVFARFRDAAYFRQVRIDAASGTICWPNGVDLDPVVLYSAATGTPLNELLERP